VFEDMYIPWTPRLRRRPEPAPQPEAPTTSKPQLCTRTLHVARAVVAHAAAPFPEIAAAVSAAFIAYIRGHLIVNTTGEPTSWAAAPLQEQPAT
jgi:hypothetical protein